MSPPFPKFRELIIRPVLEELEMWSPAAENLVFGTALTESGLGYLKQTGKGPALGLWQMEPATVRDISRYLARRLDLRDRLRPYCIDWPFDPDELPGNLYLSCALCRIHYWRVPDALPRADDLAGLGRYWKQYYNTINGAGTVNDFLLRAGRILED